jgi:hypothetical protein
MQVKPAIKTNKNTERVRIVEAASRRLGLKNTRPEVASTIVYRCSSFNNTSNLLLLRIAMHRTITVGLLSICLAVFLCPAVGKPDAVVWVMNKPALVFTPQEHSCASEPKACHNVSKPSGNCCDHEQGSSQPSHCCPTPCSALVLMCSITEQGTAPVFDALSIFTIDCTGEVRADRPPIPPPRV